MSSVCRKGLTAYFTSVSSANCLILDRCKDMEITGREIITAGRVGRDLCTTLSGD